MFEMRADSPTMQFNQNPSLESRKNQTKKGPGIFSQGLKIKKPGQTLAVHPGMILKRNYTGWTFLKKKRPEIKNRLQVQIDLFIDIVDPYFFLWYHISQNPCQGFFRISTILIIKLFKGQFI